MEESKLILTPSALLAFLSEIEELQDYSLSLSENEGELIVSIGDSQYILQSPEESTVEIDTEVIEDIEDIDEDGYDEIDNYVEDEPVEGGIIKELAKTLLVGGLVRLTKNAIMKS